MPSRLVDLRDIAWGVHGVMARNVDQLDERTQPIVAQPDGRGVEVGSRAAG
ncbi:MULTISPECIES: hypothetical protein [Xanthomonas]|uniref:Uncharacterized protein n=1 Tax=Xanthomonas cucurbitae TaxID=56453 RepID=A0ABY7YDP5_9XANT|nr:hypothetical protein [Xanthomonas cucurbitae]WDM71990.1 hypothetical protein K6978_01945 [Xanthomonas cucurbitae]WDM75077.1 hypothetical protein K6982_17280 [Xanthomonas cucurbitae]WDM78784.1 hypothetical protein K6980_16900 [Xanthomonas cucurbitae]WDM82463.1 hypothetical protein K6979_16895 [Xanthomonas cucurbitae]